MGSVKRRAVREYLANMVPLLDVAAPREWRRFVPAWLRALIWVDSSQSYDAFLSYSWKSDSKIAPVIQSVIQRFLCPWYKLRAKTVFRDLSCLPAGSSLEFELFDRLDRSAHLIVLASPEAAHSGGMLMEAIHWFSRHRDGQILIIVTAGQCQTWEDIRDQLLPPAMRDNLTQQPLWVPLQHRRAQFWDDPNRHQLREELVEDLKQVLLRFYPGRDWGQLCGEERAQRRPAVGLLSGVALVFLLLAVAAAGFARYAQKQRLLAESRAFAAQAEQMVARDQPAALALAIRGWHTAKTAEANFAVAHAFPQLLSKLEGHTGGVFHAVFSPDGWLVVTASDDKTARVWNAANGQLLATLEGHTGSVFHAAFSPDGQRIVTAGVDKTARVWNAANGHLLSKLEGHTQGGVQAAFSPDSQRIVTASYDETARVWNAANGQLLATLEGHTSRVGLGHIRPGYAAFSPDGRHIVTASDDKTARVWNAANGQLLAALEGHTDSVNQAAFSPDGQRIVTASDDKTARVWNAAIGQSVATIEGHTGSVSNGTFSPDGQRIVTASDDKTARVWNAASGQLLAALEGHTMWVRQAAFSPDGQRIVTASEDGTARVYRAVTLSDLAELLGK
jgi:WD40 repeat protein